MPVKSLFVGKVVSDMGQFLKDSNRKFSFKFCMPR